MMSANLFSIFDPSTSNFFSNNWTSLLVPMMIFPMLYWATPSLYQTPYFIIYKTISKELKNNISKLNFQTLLTFFTIFWLILWNNVMGLFPYVFTSSSHLITTMTLAFPLWCAFMLYGWLQMTNHMFSHLVPQGSPMALSLFMVLIETTSNIIRPLTLSIRLTANMIAGHLLLSLLSGLSENLPVMIFPSSLVILTLLTLEYAVAIIQSYVFITLLSLYLNEIN